MIDNWIAIDRAFTFLFVLRDYLLSANNEPKVASNRLGLARKIRKSHCNIACREGLKAKLNHDLNNISSNFMRLILMRIIQKDMSDDIILLKFLKNNFPFLLFLEMLHRKQIFIQ